MSQRAATIGSLPAAFEVMKAMRAHGVDWGADHRAHGRAALIDILQEQMDDGGPGGRRPLTELGEIEL